MKWLTDSTNTAWLFEAKLITTVLHELDMTANDLARLVGCSPETVRRYLHGMRVPTRIFLLNLLEWVPDPRLRYGTVSRALGHRWVGSKDPRAHRTRAEFVTAVRILAGRSRRQFAINLGVPLDTLIEVEEGYLPERAMIENLAKKFLVPDFTTHDVVAAFRALQPSEEESEIRAHFHCLNDSSLTEQQRRHKRDDLIYRFAPMAQEMAARVARRLRRPEVAEEIWGEPLMQAVVGHDPRLGLFPSYLNGIIRGYAATLIWPTRRRSIDTNLTNFGKAVREAEEELPQILGRTPTERDIARYVDVSPRVVSDVRRARLAGWTAGSDELERLPLYIPTPSDTESPQETMLSALSDEQRELVFLHYLDGASVEELAETYDVSQEEVLAELKWAVALLSAED
jgi:DNA-directed RNA polymerase specialized sigma24 family protein